MTFIYLTSVNVMGFRFYISERSDFSVTLWGILSTIPTPHHIKPSPPLVILPANISWRITKKQAKKTSLYQTIAVFGNSVIYPVKIAN